MAGISRKVIRNKAGKERKGFTITYRDIYGKQHTAGFYRTRNEAQEHLHEYKDINPEIKDITFAQIFKPYLDFAKVKYSHTTYETRELYYKLHFSKLSDIKYEKLSSLDLEQFITDIELKCSPSVAQMCLKIGMAAVNYAKKHKLVTENKFESVTKIKVPKKPPCHLTESQEQHILKCCSEIYPKLHDFFYLLMGTGMREGEAIALYKENIDFENSRLLVDKQFTKGKLRLVPKGHSSYRYVYLTDDVLEILKKRIKMLPQNTKLVFPNINNGFLNIGNIRRRNWEPLLVYAGIKEHVTIHGLRGSYADIAFSKGASVKFVQNQLGHAKAQTTLDIYTQNNKDIIADGLNKINGFLKPSNQDFIPDK